MSRHKLVKTLDLDEELDDFDGIGDYDNGEEQVNADDREQLRVGTVQVRSRLGPGVVITDQEIQESLWYYYYDIEKTVNYIINQKTPKSERPKQPKEVGEAKTLNGFTRNRGTFIPPTCCKSTISAVKFFEDAPWMKIPKDRLGKITIEPQHPKGLLLGGAPLQDGKVSKLAALAAASKRKRSAEVSSQSSNTSANLHDRLSATGASNKANESVALPDFHPSNKPNLPNKATNILENSKQLDSTTPHGAEQARKDGQIAFNSKALYHGSTIPLAAPKAVPSKFAKTMFGDSENLQKKPDQPMEILYFRVPQAPDANFDAFAGPSPEDIVLKAQSSKKQKRNEGSTQPPKENKTASGLVNGMKNISIEETSRVKSKNLDVIAEFEKRKFKNAMNFVVIGHVDAGKSTLMGRLLYDLKMVDQRTIDKYRREAESIGKSSFALAWVLDQGTEERNRGVTIDIATNKFETEKTSFTILDAPGHQDFIPNMIAGASQADFAVLVIDASIGSFESGLKGQTKEHALLVRSMGVSRIVVAVNKLDTVHWSRARFEEISTQVSAFLTAAGFLQKNVEFIPCSGLTGENVVRSSQNTHLSWYTGPPLISALESSEPVTRAIEKPLRLTISNIFRGGITHPLSISGRLDSGNIQTGDSVLCMPSVESATIKGIEADSASSCDWAVAGQNVTLHLADIEVNHLKPGDVICSLTAPAKNVKNFSMKILAFEHIMPMYVEVHRGRLQSPGRITQLTGILDKGTGAIVKGKKPKLLKPGMVARITVELEEAAPLEAMGRVILRAGGETIGAGLVE